MTSEQIVLTKSVDPSLVELGKINGKYISVNYPKMNAPVGEYTKLKIQTPKMKIPWDIQTRKTRDGKLFAYSVSVSTNPIGTDKNKNYVDLFSNKFKEIEEKIKSKLPETFKNKTFYSSLWQGADKTYKPIVKFTIPCFKEETPTTTIFDKEDVVVNIKELSKGMICTFIVKLDSIWSTDDKVGINWYLDQIKIHEEEKRKTYIRDDLDE